MDMHCRHCAEPWDLDCIHEEIAIRYGEPDEFANDGQRDVYDDQYAEVSADFRVRGCEALGQEHTEHEGGIPDELSDMIAVAQELCGDDMDGAAAMLEDFGL